MVGEAKTAKNNEYRVEFPDMEGDIEMIPAPPLVTEENLWFSLRNAQNKMERVDEKARAAAKRETSKVILESPTLLIHYLILNLSSEL